MSQFNIPNLPINDIFMKNIEYSPHTNFKLLPQVLVLLLVVAGVWAQIFSEEEHAALEELREAGLLEQDVQAILETLEEDPLYFDLQQDEAEDRGGPQ